MNRGQIAFGAALLAVGIVASVASGDTIYVGALIPGVGSIVRGVMGQPVVAGKPDKVARGMGPTWFRIVLVVLAGLYFGVLLKHPKKVRPRDGDSAARSAFVGVLDSIAHFSECTGLFPEAAKIGKPDGTWVPGGHEYRFEAWSCDRKQWELLDTRPYFPIQADDKESRLPRLLHYYFEEADDKAMRQTTMFALDDYIYEHHDGDADGVAGPIGGIRMTSVRNDYGAPGDPVERYSFDPHAPIPTGSQVQYNTPHGTRKDNKPGIRKRCKVTDAAPDPIEPEVSTPAPGPKGDPWGGAP